MLPKYNPDLVSNAKNLRKNMTKEERHLWYDFLKDYPVKFVRQKVLGKYIADFYCASAKLVIELDGSQHYMEEGLKYDAIRTEYIQEFGIEVIRIPNNYLNSHFESVCAYIDECVKHNIPSVGKADSSPCNKGSLAQSSLL